MTNQPAHLCVSFFVLLCLAQPRPAQKQNTPDQIASAHTVAISVHATKPAGGRYLGISDPAIEAQLTADAQASLSRVPGLSVTADSTPPDLVFLLLFADWKTPYGEDLGLIFSGNAPAASTVPLWVGEGESGFSAADYFVAKLTPSQKAASLSFIVPGRMARLRSQSKHATTAGKTLRSTIPDELLQAKSAAIFAYSPETPWGIQLSHPFLKGSLGASLEKWGRFKIVDNPQDADLIFVIYTDQHQDAEVHSHRFESYTREALIIFPNNTQPPNSAPLPLWMEQVDEKEIWGASVKLDLIYLLRKDLERAETR